MANYNSDELEQPNLKTTVINNEDYFNSIIFNLLYYIYNNLQANNVYFRVKEIPIEHKFYFEIIASENKEEFLSLLN